MIVVVTGGRPRCAKWRTATVSDATGREAGRAVPQPGRRRLAPCRMHRCGRRSLRPRYRTATARTGRRSRPAQNGRRQASPRPLPHRDAVLRLSLSCPSCWPSMFVPHALGVREPLWSRGTAAVDLAILADSFRQAGHGTVARTGGMATGDARQRWRRCAMLARCVRSCNGC